MNWSSKSMPILSYSSFAKPFPQKQYRLSFKAFASKDSMFFGDRYNLLICASEATSACGSSNCTFTLLQTSPNFHSFRLKLTSEIVGNVKDANDARILHFWLTIKTRAFWSHGHSLKPSKPRHGAPFAWISGDPPGSKRKMRSTACQEPSTLSCPAVQLRFLYAFSTGTCSGICGICGICWTPSLSISRVSLSDEEGE